MAAVLAVRVAAAAAVEMSPAATAVAMTCARVARRRASLNPTTSALLVSSPSKSSRPLYSIFVFLRLPSASCMQTPHTFR